MDIEVFGVSYNTIKDALKAYNITKPRYDRCKNSCNSAGEAIEFLVKKDREREINQEWKRTFLEAGFNFKSVKAYRDKFSTPDEAISYLLAKRKEKEKVSELVKYRKEKGVNYERLANGRRKSEFKGLSDREIIDKLSEMTPRKAIEEVEIGGVVYPSIRAVLDKYNISVERYNNARKKLPSAKEAIESLIQSEDTTQRGRKKAIVVGGMTFNSVSDFCRYMNISSKSIYDRKRRYKYDSIEKCANDYYNLVKKAGGTKENKVFRRLSVEVNGKVCHGLDDFLKQNNVSRQSFMEIKEFYYPELPIDKWYIVARRYEKLKEKYIKDKRKVIRGKKYATIKDVCDDYGVSRPQVYWYRDLYRPGADAWDIIEDYLDFKEKENHG